MEIFEGAPSTLSIYAFTLGPMLQDSSTSGYYLGHALSWQITRCRVGQWSCADVAIVVLGIFAAEVPVASSTANHGLRDVSDTIHLPSISCDTDLALCNNRGLAASLDFELHPLAPECVIISTGEGSGHGCR